MPSPPFFEYELNVTARKTTTEGEESGGRRRLTTTFEKKKENVDVPQIVNWPFRRAGVKSMRWRSQFGAAIVN